MAVAREISGVGGLDSALMTIVERTAEIADADIVVARLLDDSGGLTARAVHAASAALRAELEGSRLDPDAMAAGENGEPPQLPPPLRRIAERLGARDVLQLPVLDGGTLVGSLELLRRRSEFGERERRLAAGSDETRAADQVATLAAEATGARACLVWRYEPQGPVLSALSGSALQTAAGLDAVQRSRGGPGSLSLEPVEDGGALVTLQLGEPPQGALRAGERRETLTVELQRTRALLTIVGQAIAQLSLSHTLQTAIEHVSDLLGAERLAVYLSEERGQRLEPAAERGLTGPHVRVAERLLELLLVPAHGRGLLGIPYAATDTRLRGAQDVLEEIGIEAAIAVPLRARDDLIGVLAVYPEAGRELTEYEEELLLALAAQLAVAVENARLHERTKRADDARREALEAEREATRRLRALYDISSTFSESLSLDQTLEAVTRTIVETLHVDAAVLRMPDPRGDALVPVALNVREERLEESMRAILSLPQPLTPVAPRAFRSGHAVVLDGRTA